MPLDIFLLSTLETDFEDTARLTATNSRVTGDGLTR